MWPLFCVAEGPVVTYSERGPFSHALPNALTCFWFLKSYRSSLRSFTGLYVFLPQAPWACQTDRYSSKKNSLAFPVSNRLHAVPQLFLPSSQDREFLPATYVVHISPSPTKFSNMLPVFPNGLKKIPEENRCNTGIAIETESTLKWAVVKAGENQ